MQPELLAYLKTISPEEQTILDGDSSIQKELYTSKKEFVIDSRKLLEKGHLVEIRPHTRFAHFPKHRHNYVEMIYMCSGTTTHILNDTSIVQLHEGDLLFINQNTTQEILPAGENDIGVNFIILPQFFDRTMAMMEEENLLRDFLISTLSQNTAQANYLYFQAQDLCPVRNLIENMIWTLIHKRSGMNLINQTTMGLLFMNLSALALPVDHGGTAKREQTLIFHILKYIETHYNDGTLLEISDEIKQPTYYVSRLLKKYTGFNFKELLQQRKLQQAAYLLSHTTLPTASIITAIGYDNSSYFYRKFREKYGCSPKKFRQGN